MALFMLVPALILLGIVLLAPLMLPGAVLAFVLVAIAQFIWRHHNNRALHSH
jgi:hypothetical protein